MRGLILLTLLAICAGCHSPIPARNTELEENEAYLREVFQRQRGTNAFDPYTPIGGSAVATKSVTQ
jgi:hypothetical protein